MYNSIWYDSLVKPVLNPPSWIFPPVWSILYALIIISLFIYIFKNSLQNKSSGYVYFIIQLILNLAWSPIFFYFKNIGLALIIVVLLDYFVILTIKRFYSVSKISAILLIPYLLWILFATYLNTAFLILN